MNNNLKKIEELAQYCDEELSLELNRRLQAILDWVIEKNQELDTMRKIVLGDPVPPRKDTPGLNSDFDRKLR